MGNKILAQFKLLGIVFLALLVAGVYLTYAIFTKKFVDYDRVTLDTSSIGLQLPSRADIKIRGEIVGEVLDYDATSSGATVTLGLNPDKVKFIPDNVTGSIVPKTLFGEKYVSLLVPDQPSKKHIEPGATITRTRVSTEVERVLSDLYPLLTTVQPGQINMTLNAIATALEGRGEAIGENLETIDGYLQKLNPQIPALVDDLRLTSKVSDLYTDVLPQISTILRNTIKTTGTLEDRSAQLKALFDNVSNVSDTTGRFLDDNERNLIELGDLTKPQLQVLAKYAPEFPCLLQGVVNADKRQAEAFRGFTLHIVLEVLPRQPRGYTAADQPRNGENRGYSCLDLPNPKFSQANPFSAVPNLDDGVDSPTGKGTDRVAPRYYRNPAAYAGTPLERDVLNTMIAPAFGMTPSEVPDLAALLLAPMARGTRVSLR